jgi:hypothetical protein
MYFRRTGELGLHRTWIWLCSPDVPGLKVRVPRNKWQQLAYLLHVRVCDYPVQALQAS